MDDTTNVEINILEVLENNGKATPDEISEVVGVPKEKVREIIGELERKGVIRKYKASIDWSKLDGYVYAIIEVKVALEREKGYDHIAERISRFSEVVSVRLISGDHDLSLTVRGKSMKDVAFFVADKIATLPQVVGTSTHFVLKTYKEDGVYMGEEPKDSRLKITF